MIVPACHQIRSYNMGCIHSIHTHHDYSSLQSHNIEDMAWYKYMCRYIEQQCFTISGLDTTTRAHIAHELIMYPCIQRWSNNLDNVTLLYIELTNIAQACGTLKKYKEFEVLASSIETVIHRCIQQQDQIKSVM